MFNKFFEQAIQAWGSHAQIRQLIEEMAELTTALCHYERTMTNEDFAKVLEEMGDVELCLEQAKHIFGFEHLITDFIIAKVKRTTAKLPNSFANESLEGFQ